MPTEILMEHPGAIGRLDGNDTQNLGVAVRDAVVGTALIRRHLDH